MELAAQENLLEVREDVKGKAISKVSTLQVTKDDKIIDYALQAKQLGGKGIQKCSEKPGLWIQVR